MRCVLLAVVLLLAGTAAAEAARYLEQFVFVADPTDPNKDCLLTIEADDDTPQSIQDVVDTRSLIEQALAGSQDMRVKVADACGKQSNALKYRLWRDDKSIYLAHTARRGFIDIDLSDLEGMDAHMDGDPSDIMTVMNHMLLSVIAHETDHNRHGNGASHLDPSGARRVKGNQGKAVDDENQVFQDLLIFIDRREYIYHDPNDKVDKWDYELDGLRKVTFNYTDHLTERTALSKFGAPAAHTVSPSLVLFSPGEACAPGGSSSCFPPHR